MGVMSKGAREFVKKIAEALVGAKRAKNVGTATRQIYRKMRAGVAFSKARLVTSRSPWPVAD